MPADQNLVLTPKATKTATANGTPLENFRTRADGLVARIIYTGASVSASTGSATLKVQSSADNSTWTDLASTVVALSTTVVSGEVFHRITGNHRYLRLSLSAISGTDATITYQGDIVAAIP